MQKIIEVTLIRSKKLDRLEAPPQFPAHASYFHPLPSCFQDQYSAGDTVRGRYGKQYDTGRQDKRGKRIYVSYFIPKGEHNEKE